VIPVITLHLCRHQFGLLTRAVTAYQPAADEKADHQDLVAYLTVRAEENAPVELDPEDIPY
jgi:hypothetical protein